MDATAIGDHRLTVPERAFGEPPRFQCLLSIHSIVYNVCDELCMGLGLILTTHDAKPVSYVAVVSDDYFRYFLIIVFQLQPQKIAYSSTVFT
jgi:hypothetical protein